MISLSTANPPREWRGLSTDTKPIEGVRNGDTFFEIDTTKVFMFNEQALEWKEL